MPNFSGAVPLGGSNDAPRFERLSEQDKRDLEALAADTGTTGAKSVPTAFLVIVPENGVAFATPDLTAAAGYAPQHAASVPEMHSACHYVADRIHDSMLIQGMVTTSMQTAAALQRQAEDVAIAKGLGLN